MVHGSTPQGYSRLSIYLEDTDPPIYSGRFLVLERHAYRTQPGDLIELGTNVMAHYKSNGNCSRKCAGRGGESCKQAPHSAWVWIMRGLTRDGTVEP